MTHLMTLVLLVSFCLMLPQAAHAYIDPGTGSYVIQLVIAGLLGASFAIKIYWKKIKAFFANHYSKSPRDGIDND
jgi:hypothetical protein